MGVKYTFHLRMKNHGVVTESLSEIIARLEAEREEAKRQAEIKIEIMLAIDTSGSMYDSRIEKAKQSAKDFVDQFDLSRTKISVIAFADRSAFACKWSSDRNELFKAITNIDDVSVGGATSARPIEDNYRAFSPKAFKIMVVLTDGYWSNQDSEVLAANRAKNNDITMYGIGIGEADQEFLDKISSGKGKKVDVSQLTAAFKEVASSIATEVANTTLR